MEIFYSYSYSEEDEKLQQELEKHLRQLQREKLITSWHKNALTAGSERRKEIDIHLNGAEIILLLVSSDFIASDDNYNIEVGRAMERYEAGEAQVIPIILRPCDWHTAPFGKLQPLPKNGTPITKWTNQDEAFLDVVGGIRQVCSQRISQLENSAKSNDNPFFPLSGSIDNPELLFARDREIRDIFELLNIGSSVALIGERAIGKSSVLRAIKRQAESRLYSPRKPVYLNLSQIFDDNQFYFSLCDRAGIDCDPDRPLQGYFLERELNKHRILLLLDEAENIGWDGFTNPVRSQLRGLAQTADAPLKLVIVADKPINQLFTDSNIVSPFENICVEVAINRWQEGTVREFIRSRLAATPIEFSKTEIQQLIEESGGHPQQLMQRCYKLYKSKSS